jgi:magnesium transporter
MARKAKLSKRIAHRTKAKAQVSPTGGSLLPDSMSVVPVYDHCLIPDDDDDDQLMDFNYDLPGSLPGTLNIPEDALPTEFILMAYGKDGVDVRSLNHLQECRRIPKPYQVSWLDARGLGSEDKLWQFSQVFQIHPLMLEDVVNVPHRPKVDFYEDQILLIMQMVRSKDGGSGVGSEQVSFVLGRDFLVTFQEEPEWDSFEPVRDRIRRGTGSIRRQGADYLAYALLDTIVDSFFPVLEELGEALEELENEVVENPTQATIEKIYRMRRGLMKLRRYIWPQRNVINSLIRDSDDLISQEVKVYLQDVYDHIVQVVDILENYRETASSLMDVYLSSISNRMNEVMKLLTVISSIFIPLTFIAGVYGMNFNPEKSPWNMPELEWPWGYVACLGVMGAIALLQVIFFWRRGWFKNFSPTRR